MRLPRIIGDKPGTIGRSDEMPSRPMANALKGSVICHWMVAAPPPIDSPGETGGTGSRSNSLDVARVQSRTACHPGSSGAPSAVISARSAVGDSIESPVRTG